MYHVVDIALSVHMLSKSQSWTLDAGQTAHLECEFIADDFNLFDNPIIWRKSQQIRRSPTTTPTSLVPHGTTGSLPICYYYFELSRR